MAGRKGVPARRPIEREYLTELNAAVPLKTWRAICKRAADDAMKGDPKAREFLAKWLLGLESRALTVLAAEEAGNGPAAVADGEIAAMQQHIERGRRLAERIDRRERKPDACESDGLTSDDFDPT